MRRFASACAALVLTGCATPSTTPFIPPATQVLLLGEQHDAPEHQQWERDTVQQLAERGRLATVVMEMAEAGHSTAGLPADASEAQARAALAWNDAAWPWAKYGPVAMAAVRAGVPVLGGNLPRAQMRAAMQDTAFDTHLPSAALQRQYQALRTGHCGLLPETQIAPMARIQLARDASLARTAEAALQPGKTVVLVAGLGHVQRSLGVPTWLPPDLEQKVAIAQAGQALAAIEKEADWIHPTPALPPQDPCAELKKRIAPEKIQPHDR
ncbi:MAG: ChaN family lipoprotein [Acidovorax sp.]